MGSGILSLVERCLLLEVISGVQKSSLYYTKESLFDNVPVLTCTSSLEHSYW